MANGITPAIAPADSPLLHRPPLVDNRRDLRWVSQKISHLVEGKTFRWWWGATIVAGLIALLAPLMFAYLVSTGLGVWGLNHPVMWGWAIINFVFWIGIGHAGTLISAILFILRQKWRTAINRSAEAMTLFAVMCAGLFPLFHVGRMWMIWFLAPVPTSFKIWQNFKSPLIWDFFAVSTYFIVSAIFWYVGLIPDLATLRDRATSRARQRIYGILALGWRGAHRQWRHYEKAYLILAGIATPLVLSVHSVVSTDFAVSILPGWHTTIYPPYFVAGAIFGGFAMVLTLLLPIRALYGLQDIIQPKHIDNMCKIILLTGLLVTYAYAMEFFMAWYSVNLYEQYAFLNRVTGPYRWFFWAMIFCNVAAPQAFWFKACRRNLWVVFIVANLVTIGMWLERFVIIVTTLHRGFLPSTWGYYSPTCVDILTFAGTVGFFVFMFLLFIRFLPMITMFEVKAIVAERAAGSAETEQPRAVVVSPLEISPAPGSARKPYGLGAEFPDSAALLRAAGQIRDRGFKHWDVHSPFPIHGMDAAMGLSNSRVSSISLYGGIVGLSLAFFMIYYTGVIDFPLIVHGKPFFSLNASFPVFFEMTILLCAFGTLFGMLGFSLLPRYHHPVFNWEEFKRVTDDGFFAVIESKDPRFSEVETRRFLEEIGGANVTRIPISE